MSFKFFRRHQKKMLWVVVVITILTFSLFSVTSTMRACFGRTTGGVGEFTLLDETVIPISPDRHREVREFLGRFMGDAFTPDKVWEHIILYAEAEHAGINISDQEFQESIDSLFGRRLTAEEYRQVVTGSGFSSAWDFEKAWRELCMVSKLRHFYDQADDCILTEDVYEEYKLQNEEFKVDYISFPAEAYAGELKAEDVDDAKLKEFYDTLRVGMAKEEYVIPEYFSLDAGYADLTSCDFESFADLTADITIEDSEAQWYYYQNEERFVIEADEPGAQEEPSEEAPESQDPAESEDPSASQEPVESENPSGGEKDGEEAESEAPKKHKSFEEVKDQIVNELKIIKLVDKAMNEWMEFVRDNDLIGRPESAAELGEDAADAAADKGAGETAANEAAESAAGETAANETAETAADEAAAGEATAVTEEAPADEAGPAVDADAFFRELCDKYHLSFERIEGPVAWTDLDKLERFGSEDLKTKAKPLRRNAALTVKPGEGDNPGTMVILARVTSKTEPKLKDYDAVRDILLEDYLYRERMALARSDADGLIDAMDAKLREMDEFKPRVEELQAAAGERAEQEIAGRSADNAYTEEQAAAVREREQRVAENQIKSELKKERHRVWEGVFAERGLSSETIDYYSKSAARDSESLEKESEAAQFIKGRMSFRIAQMAEGDISDPLRDEENGAFYVVRMADRRFPPPETMTAKDIEEGRDSLRSSRMMAKFRAQQAEAQRSRQGELPVEDSTDPLSTANILRRYHLRIYEATKEEPVEDYGDW